MPKKEQPKYYSTHVARGILGVTAQTMRNWDKKGILKPHHTTQNGHRYYAREDINSFRKNECERLIVGYCRVSNRKQMDDLERQVENVRTYLLSKGRPFKIIEDVGSGINYKKKGLRELISAVEENTVEKVVVLYKDRLVQFGFDLLEEVFATHDCKIEVIDSSEKTEEHELVEDLVQIVTVFSCRLQGKRAGKAKELVKSLLDKDDEKQKQ